jgi:hypothetical protein
MATKNDEGYAVKVTGPGHTFERDIGEDIATKIITFVMGGAELHVGSGNNSGDAQSNRSSTSTSGEQPTPRQFMGQKKPENNYERVACLAYYLTKYRHTPHFTTADISNLNTESAHSFTNAAQFVRDAATKYCYLSAAGGRNKQITNRGEAIVEALPDRAKVAEAAAEHKPARKRTAKRRKSK